MARMAVATRRAAALLVALCLGAALFAFAAPPVVTLRQVAVPARLDFNGDGKADVLWRHAVAGENCVYPMDGTTIKPTEGYLRTVPQANWQLVGERSSENASPCDERRTLLPV